MTASLNAFFMTKGQDSEELKVSIVMDRHDQIVFFPLKYY